jgi:hypothetical protein
MEQKFNLNDVVEYILGDGHPYKIVATKENPIPSNGITNSRPAGANDYTVVSLKLNEDGNINPYIDVPKQHLNVIEK